LGTDARKAVLSGVEGSMRSANSMIYGKSAAAGSISATGTVSVQGNNITTAWGYAATTTALILAMDVSPTITAATSTTMAVSGGSGNCLVTYGAATSATAPPTYAQDFSGC
jgi:MSHA pilin protein MshA